eukprot:g60282.t1
MTTSTQAGHILVFVLAVLGGLFAAIVLVQWDTVVIYMLGDNKLRKPLAFVRAACPFVFIWTVCMTFRLLFFWGPGPFPPSPSLKHAAAFTYCGIHALERAMILLFVRNLATYLLLCSKKQKLASSGILTSRAPVVLTSVVFLACSIAAAVTVEFWTDEIVSLLFHLEMFILLTYLVCALNAVEKQLRLGHTVLAQRAAADQNQKIPQGGADQNRTLPSPTTEIMENSAGKTSPVSPAGESMQHQISSELNFLRFTRLVWLVDCIFFASTFFYNVRILRGIIEPYSYQLHIGQLAVGYCIHYLAILASVILSRQILRREFARLTGREQLTQEQVGQLGLGQLGQQPLPTSDPSPRDSQHLRKLIAEYGTTPLSVWRRINQQQARPMVRLSAKLQGVQWTGPSPDVSVWHTVREPEHAIQDIAEFKFPARRHHTLPNLKAGSDDNMNGKDARPTGGKDLEFAVEGKPESDQRQLVAISTTNPVYLAIECASPTQGPVHSPMEAGSTVDLGTTLSDVLKPSNRGPKRQLFRTLNAPTMEVSDVPLEQNGPQLSVDNLGVDAVELSHSSQVPAPCHSYI